MFFKQTFKLYSIISFLLGLFLVAGCGGPSSNQDSQSSTGVINPKEVTITGYIQKGPFILGSSITVQELNEDFSLTGKTYTIETDDDFGSFSITGEFATDYIEIIAQGYYFNEITGDLSSSMLTMKAYADLSTNNDINVNLLTTLSKDRIEYLIDNEDKRFNEARIQAKTEILKIFNIPDTEISKIINFDQMDISQEGDSNAMLLAASVILQGSNTVAELSELVAKLSQDIKNDGVLDNPAYINELRENAMSLNYQSIKTNLENRYNDLGITPVVPDFEDYGDKDGDSIIDMHDYTLLTPEGVTNNTKPTLDWTDSKLEGIKYHVQLSEDMYFNTIIEEANIDESYYSVNTILLNNHTYYWRVFININNIESNWAGDNEFTVDIGTVTLSNPGVALPPDSMPTLSWEASSIPNAIYKLQISEESDFNNILEEANDISETSYNAVSTFINDEIYYWRVCVIDENGIQSVWSAPNSFYLERLDTNTGLLAYYEFDGNTFDSSENNKDATGKDGAFDDDRDSNVNSSYKLYSNNSYLEIPNVLDISRQEWSYSVWFRLDQYPPSGGGAGILATEDSSGAFGDVPLYISAADHTLRSYNGRIAYSDFEIGLNQWYHVVIVIDHHTLSYYVNGTLVKLVEDFTDTDSNGSFGSYSKKYYVSQYIYYDQPIYFNGAIDDVRFYNKALNEYEVTQLYNENE